MSDNESKDDPNKVPSAPPMDVNVLSVEARQRDWRERWRGLFLPRRDNLRVAKSQAREGFYLVADRLKNLVALSFNYRNPLAMLGGALQFCMDTASKLVEYKIKTTYAKEDALVMRSMMWDHANKEALKVIVDRPMGKDGKPYEIKDLRAVLIGAFNDDFSLQSHPDPKRGDKPTDRRLIADALGHSFDEASGKISDAPIPEGRADYDPAKFERARAQLTQLAYGAVK